MLELRTKLHQHKTNTELLFQKALIESLKDEQKRFRFPLLITQAIIGWYIVDFLLPHKRLIIELDGKQHFSLSGRTDDIIRDGYLKKIGFDILRYSNTEVKQNIDEIIEYINLWASLESPLGNMYKVKKIIKTQRILKETGKLERIVKEKEFNPSLC